MISGAETPPQILKVWATTASLASSSTLVINTGKAFGIPTPPEIVSHLYPDDRVSHLVRGLAIREREKMPRKSSTSPF